MDLDLGEVAQGSSRTLTGRSRIVNANRSKKEMQRLSLLEKFIIEGNEKQENLQQRWQGLDGGNMAQVRAIPIQEE